MYIYVRTRILGFAFNQQTMRIVSMNEQTIYSQADYKGNVAVQMTTVAPMVVQQRETR